MLIQDSLFWASTKTMPNGCIEWQKGKNDAGYGKVRRRKIGKNLLAHRYAYYLLHGFFPKYYACHTCDNPACVNPYHLFDGTNSDNQKDAVKKGRSHAPQLAGLIGENNENSKLTEEKVREIKSLLSTETNIALGKLYGVHHSTISCIRLRKKWSHIK